MLQLAGSVLHHQGEVGQLQMCSERETRMVQFAQRTSADKHSIYAVIADAVESKSRRAHLNLKMRNCRFFEN